MSAQAPAKRKERPQVTTDVTLMMPPQNLSAERSVLACVLLDNRVYDEISDQVKAGYFYLDVHSTIWTTMARLLEQAKAVDAVTLADALGPDMLQECGGVPYLLEVMEEVPHTAHAKHYAEIVREKFLERTLQDICQVSLRSLHEQQDDTETLIETHERAVFDLTDQRTAQNQETSITDILIGSLQTLQDRMANPSQVPGLASGFTELDLLTNGFQPHELIIIAARPSMGKTAFVCNLAEWVVNTGHPALLFSLEQSKHEIAMRLLCIRARLDGHRVKKGVLEPDERFTLLQAADEMSKLPLYIDDQPGRTMTEIRSISRRIKRRHGLKLVIIDYLQLIEPETNSRNSNRENDVAQISRRLKGLAKELEVPVIALSQLNRGVDNREDKRPRLSDLRESGAIEQDADIVMFLHRPDAYDPTDRPGEAEVIVAKHRSGKTGIVGLQWLSHSMRFADKESAAEREFT